MEKRNYRRHLLQARVVVSPFNTERRHEARMQNYSEGGMYFESLMPLKERTPLLLLLENTSGADARKHFGLRNQTLGEIRWIREPGDARIQPYGYGVKYY